MTLKEMKIKTFSLIEEYYPDRNDLAEDSDVLNKINSSVNTIMLDLMPYKKIPAKYEFKVTPRKNTLVLDTISDLYQIDRIIGAEYQLIADYEIVFDLKDEEEIQITIYYYKYPKMVELIHDKETGKTEQEIIAEYDESFQFDLAPELLEIMPCGIAADILKMDMISGYGKYFYERYLEMKKSIDPRKSTGIISITGGIDI